MYASVTSWDAIDRQRFFRESILKKLLPKKSQKIKTNHTHKKKIRIYIYIYFQPLLPALAMKKVSVKPFFFPVDQIPATNFCLTAKNIILADNKLLLFFAAMFLCKFKPVSRNPLIFLQWLPDPKQATAQHRFTLFRLFACFCAQS